jgi:hypothetical protein
LAHEAQQQWGAPSPSLAPQAPAISIPSASLGAGVYPQWAAAASSGAGQKSVAATQSHVPVVQPARHSGIADPFERSRAALARSAAATAATPEAAVRAQLEGQILTEARELDAARAALGATAAELATAKAELAARSEEVDRMRAQLAELLAVTSSMLHVVDPAWRGADEVIFTLAPSAAGGASGRGANASMTAQLAVGGVAKRIAPAELDAGFARVMGQLEGWAHRHDAAMAITR